MSNFNSVFTPAEQKELNLQKVELKIENEKYLRKHPEVDIVLSKLIQTLLEKKPPHGEVNSLVESFFIDNDLAQMVADYNKESEAGAAK
jgi:hypothetical protein|mmetsp:Transcript_80973/g.135430  ORF Transcript_80973/g.135430 Transcript_80973/m.135430 type:complete len:89 (+) Transcript_80973:111-377(+)|eukprot:CAMPEP_0174366224 /NCGR_PEP_ID=MMETSP0811_2-20130205/80403_1 /TAXON_ID=73025 ORGANISM="Eutreptiella gymnastica-like, Strain CCMP1594" /NCGR_SAMPLE_ID=MMETSP0811_2 /ASSEMBLY_ACC=CAM_ASM_000667 /LENGTH=88 /DNA_ID=CAMNT_0015507603 /DNA_START=111 /DNA_END=377 /DNA_ORIENTATION=-